MRIILILLRVLNRITSPYSRLFSFLYGPECNFSYNCTIQDDLTPCS